MLERHVMARVIRNAPAARDTYNMELAVGGALAAAFRPGQFAHIALPGDSGRLLRRPISISYADAAAGMLGFYYATVGEGTRQMARLTADAEIDILAPLGNGFAIRPEHREIWLVGGGIGIAPLLALAEMFPDRRFRGFFGYRSGEYAFHAQRMAEAQIATDDGTLGHRGFVTELLSAALEGAQPDAVLACGPTPMFRALKAALAQYPQVQAQLSLEQRMGCGTGGCYTCVVPIGGAMKRVCKDGPVFPMMEVEL